MNATTLIVLCNHRRSLDGSVVIGGQARIQLAELGFKPVHMLSGLSSRTGINMGTGARDKSDGPIA